MYIHLVEMSKTPERAIIAADYLRDLVPDGGHIHHMPSHIDVLVGDYRRAMNTNLRATMADEKYLAQRGAQNFYSFYRMHNFQSLIYAAMMAGRAGIALEATSRMEATLTEGLLRMDSPSMAGWLEFFKSVRVHVLIRFGMWEELKALPIPDDGRLWCVTIAMTHYGKAISWAATGNLEKADEESGLFRLAASRVPDTRLAFPNKVNDILKVATAMLDGEMEYRRGNYESAFSHLRLAIQREDNLVYAEPWGWMLPTRHPYSALLLEQGRAEEASTVYEADLGLDGTLARVLQHPNNIWALHGYLECLVRLNRDQEAKIIKKQLETAAASADITVKSSCFCRLRPVRGIEIEESNGN
jgi:tetratricopeptide (TPR) repeat protein